MATSSPPPLLIVNDLTINFGGVRALQDVSFSVAPKQICGLIGPNGAGKTTVFNCLSGIYRPTAGEILFKGKSLNSESAHRMAGLGIGRTFQNLALFPEMSVRENVMVGGYCRTTAGFLRGMLAVSSARQEEEAMRRKVDELLEFFNLGSNSDSPVASLPFGLQKRVEFARALAGAPELLLLDEPAAGLNHHEVESLKQIITSVRERYGLAVLLVEHHMNLVMSVSDNVVALNFGKKIVDASPAIAQQNKELITAYLGGTHE